MVSKDKVTRGLWRLRVNGLLTQLLTAVLYSVATTSYLTSYHRLVTNPREEDVNGTKVSEMEPGLGKSELFYSSIVTALQISSVVGSLLSSFLVKLQVPYWYQYLAFHVLHILGYVLYGITTEGWEILVGMSLVGLYLGAESSLGYSYAIKMSIEWVELLKQKGVEFECQKTEEVKIRNFLFATQTFGYSIGFAFATGIAVLFAHLPIEQYCSIAWFNVACGLALLTLFALFFRGESQWKRPNDCCCKSWDWTRKKLAVKAPRPLQILISYSSWIIISMHILGCIEMLKWAYFECLLNPVLSDSFGLSLDMSSFFYLGMAVPRILGATSVFLLQKLKVKTQIIAIIGIVMAITGYILVADWQAIPYDSCTEYSPFHHPERFEEISQPATSQPITLTMLPASLKTLRVHSDIELIFGNNKVVDIPLPMTVLGKCKEDKTCPICETRNNGNSGRPCLSFLRDITTGEIITRMSARDRVEPRHLQFYSCTFQGVIQHSKNKTFCVNIYQEQTVTDLQTARIQELMVLPTDVYTAASSACMNTSSEKCHWIPFSTITNETCIDCPPICRSKDQTLTFPQVLIGLAILIATNPLVWVPTLAMTMNQLQTQNAQAIVIGTINSVNALGQGIGPIIADALYEGAQKRTFPSSILLASLHIPFLVEIIVLFRHLGPKLNKPDYEQLESEDSRD